MTPPLVTIGITCHNAADAIRRALDSALVQDWPSLEVLIVDDCSNDESVQAIAEAIANELGSFATSKMAGMRLRSTR